MLINKRFDLKGSILVFVVVGFVALAVVTAITSYLSVYNESISSVRQQNMALLTGLEGWVGVKATLVEGNAMMMRNPDATVDMIIDIFTEQAHANEDVSLVFAGFPDGNMIVGRGWGDTAYQYAPERPWYITAAESPGIVRFTRPYMGAATLRLAFAVTRTIGDHDDALGVVALSVPFDAMIHSIVRVDGNEDRYSFILDSYGDILFHPDPAFAPSTEVDFQNINNVEGGRYSQMLEAILRDGFYVGGGAIHVGALSESTGWVVITRIPSTYVIQNTLPTLVSLIVTALFALVMVTSAWAMLRRVRQTLNSEREAHEFNQLILDSAPLKICIRDDSFNIIQIGQSAAEMFGVDDPQRLVEDIFAFSPEIQPCGTPSREKADREIRKAYDEGYARFEWMHTRADGEPLPSESIFKRFTKDGKHMLVSYTVDLRRMKEAMEKERQGHAWTKKLFDSAPMFIEVWDKYGNLVECNMHSCEMFGLSSAKDFILYYDQLSPKYQPCGTPSMKKVREYVKQAFREGYVQFEWLHQDTNAEPLPVNSFYVRLSRGDEDFVVGYSQDVRQVKAAMEKEREAEERAKVLIDTAPVVCFLLDKNTYVIDCNQAALDVFVKEPDKTIIETYPNNEFLSACYYGGDCEDFELCRRNDCRLRRFLIRNNRLTFPSYNERKDEVEQMISDRCREALRKGHVKFEYTAQTLYGEVFSCEATIAAVNYQGGNGFAVYIRDLSEEKRREAAEEESKAKTRFLARMSHEVRTPMNAVMGITEIEMQKGGHTPETEAALLRIYSSSRLLLTLINDILDLSKVEAGKMEIVPSVYETASMIADTVQLNLMYVGSKRIVFGLDIDHTLPAYFIGDELRIKQILNNILTNAFKYTQEGRVDMAIAVKQYPDSDDALLIVSVTDSGRGMTQDQVDNLFTAEYTRYNLADNREIEGSGLGLPIAYSLVKMMGGNVKVRSELGKGSTFTVSIPQKISGNEVLGKEAIESLRNLEDTSKHLKRVSSIVHEPMPYGRVMVVDDVDSNLYVARGMMYPYKLMIETVESGFDAIERIKSGKEYDIIFMDHMMPKMDGIEATKLIREMGYELPVVALTANVVVGASQVFFKNGFTDFIAKPIDPYKLDACLKRFILDKQPSEVVSAARAQNSSAIKHNENRVLSDMLIESFLIDAIKSLDVLVPLTQLEELDEGALKMYIIQTHAIKSALFNINRVELSNVAELLERAGREKDFDTIKERTLTFLNDVRNVLIELSPPVGDLDSDDEAKISVSKEQWMAISEACEAYDIAGVQDMLRDLGELSLSTSSKATLDEIGKHLLLSDYDDAAALAKKTAEGLEDSA